VIILRQDRSTQCDSAGGIHLRTRFCLTGDDAQITSRRLCTNTVGLLATLEARLGKEEEIEAFLQSAGSLVEAETGTTSWYSFRIGPRHLASLTPSTTRMEGPRMSMLKWQRSSFHAPRTFCHAAANPDGGHTRREARNSHHLITRLCSFKRLQQLKTLKLMGTNPKRDHPDR